LQPHRTTTILNPNSAWHPLDHDRLRAASPRAEHALIGSVVELVSLTESHAAELYRAGQDPAIWRWLPGGEFRSIEDARAWIGRALAAAAGGAEVPFAIVERAGGAIVGSTRFLDIRPAEHALEIGLTWLAPAAQRTGLNLEAKYLMLRHAFEDRQAQRVAFFTDEHNGRARASLVRLGATYEGTLRFHRMNGVRRNSAAYSILAPEWPQVRAGIEQRMLRARQIREPFRLSVLAQPKRPVI